MDDSDYILPKNIESKSPVNDKMSEEKWFCPYCGHRLKVVVENDPYWGEFCQNYREEHGTEWFLCSNKKCTLNSSPLVLHHPVHGWDNPAGDSWAIGYVK